MTIQYINYILLAIGIFTVMGAIILIFLDKLKGEDIYFSIDVKEQEMKKVIDDAEEILSELNFTSDVIVKEIEEKINHLNVVYKDVNNSLAQMRTRPETFEPQPIPPKQTLQTQQEPQSQPQPQPQPVIQRTTVTAKFKPVTAKSMTRTAEIEEKPKSKQQQIFELADQGVSVIEIAKAMQMGQGEVALILSLKNEES